MKQLVQFNEKGIFCPIGNFYIDPKKGAEIAILTHAHSDHARRGSTHNIAHELSVPLIKHRLGNINIEAKKYGKKFKINGVTVSLHPSGHIIGASQVRLEYKGEVAVVTSDFKVEDDGITTPFELLECNTLVIESTFGRPYYKWEDQAKVFKAINEWWQVNKVSKLNSVILCYSLGKAQRLLANVDSSIGPIIADPEISKNNDIIRKMGVKLPKTIINTKQKGSLILATGASLRTGWLKQFMPYSLAEASGWMAIPNFRKRRDQGFVVSDHADWEGLNKVVKESGGADKVFVMHGYTKLFTKWLRDNNIDAYVAGEKPTESMIQLSLDSGDML